MYYDENGNECQEDKAVRYVYSYGGYTCNDIRETPRHRWRGWNEVSLMSDRENAKIRMNWAMYKNGTAMNSECYRQLAEG